MNIQEMCAMPAEDLIGVLERLDDPRGASLARQICAYLRRMVDVGVGYLSLSRRTDSISGGEAQRLKMVRHLGSPLSDITYVLDEPTAGLHPADAERIGRMLVELRDRHNSVLVVEHSRQMLELADHVVEMGPGAGTKGGEVVYEGDLPGLLTAGTPTARALAEPIALNKKPLPWGDAIRIRDARSHNLRHVDVDVPLGVLVAITGVAGSGKSTLARYELPRVRPDAVVIDQRPIGTSVRSTPATYTGAMDEIRKAFGKANGVAASWFSFNSKGGCPACKGKGTISYEMAFAEPVEVVCEECQGRRYNPTALGYTYKGLNIEEALRLTVDEAIEFFGDPKIAGPLKGLSDVGLGYLTLGHEHALGRGGPAREAGERARQDRRRLRARRAQHGPARTRRGGAANAASAHGRGRQQRDHGGSPHGARCPGRLGHRPGTRGRDWRRTGGLRGHARTAGGMQDVQDRRLAEQAHGLAPAGRHAGGHVGLQWHPSKCKSEPRVKDCLTPLGTGLQSA